MKTKHRRSYNFQNYQKQHFEKKDEPKVSEKHKKGFVFGVNLKTSKICYVSWNEDDSLS